MVGAGLAPAAADELRALPGVRVAGEVEDLRAEIAAARLTVVPIWQGGGTRLKVLESLAAARPVLGTELGVGGVGFRDGVHGRLAEDPAGLADAAIAMLAEPEATARLGAAGTAAGRGASGGPRPPRRLQRCLHAWLQVAASPPTNKGQHAVQQASTVPAHRSWSAPEPAELES